MQSAAIPPPLSSAINPHLTVAIERLSHTAMAPRTGLKSLLAGAMTLLPVLVAGYANASYSSNDMLRAQLALMNDRPADCPPW